MCGHMLGECIVELNQLGNHGVEAQMRHVCLYARNCAVEMFQ